MFSPVDNLPVAIKGARSFSSEYLEDEKRGVSDVLQPGHNTRGVTEIPGLCTTVLAREELVRSEPLRFLVFECHCSLQPFRN